MVANKPSLQAIYKPMSEGPSECINDTVKRFGGPRIWTVFTPMTKGLEATAPKKLRLNLGSKHTCEEGRSKDIEDDVAHTGSSASRH